MLKYLNIIFFLSFSLSMAAGAQDLVNELLNAVRQNDIKTVRESIGRGMSVDTSDESGNTLLMRASRDTQLEMVQTLLGLQASIKHRNFAGDTALMFAALGGNLEIVRLLAKAGADVHHAGWAPIHYCAWAGKTAVCQYLIQQGVDIDAVGLNGITPLMMAVRGGHLDTVKLLVWEFAELEVENDDGATAMDWALRNKRQDIVAHLKQAGAKQ